MKCFHHVLLKLVCVHSFVRCFIDGSLIYFPGLPGAAGQIGEIFIVYLARALSTLLGRSYVCN
jgi:hypothetical protein